MSARFSVLLVDSSGNAQTGQNVDLYADGGSKIADMTDNGDGTYYADVSTTQKIEVYVNGSKQDEFDGVVAVADDIITGLSDVSDKADKVSGATANNLAKLDANGNLADSGVATADVLDSDHVNADGAGGTSTPATNMVHNAAAIQSDNAEFNDSNVESQIGELSDWVNNGQGAPDFSSSNFLGSLSVESVVNAILKLDNVVMSAIHRSGEGNADTLAYAFTFELSGSQNGNIYMADVGFAAPTDGYIAKYVVAWSGAAISSGNTIAVGYGSTVQFQIADGEEGNEKKIANFSSANNFFSVGDVIRPRLATVGADTITDPVVTIIFIGSESPVSDYIAQGGDPS